jgi:beta-N-acetylhexosaminidase
VRHRFSPYPRWLITLALALVVLIALVVTLLLSGAGKQAARPTVTPTPTVIVSLLPSATPWLMPSPTASPVVDPVPTPLPTATVQPTPAATLPPAQTPTPTPSATPVPIPTATPGPTATCVNLASWTVLQRLNQLMMVSGDFSNLSASVPDARAGVGAFVLFGQPPAGSGPPISSGLAALYNNARASGQVLPWIATDEEGGSVARLAYVIGPLPSARQMVAQWTPAHVQAVMAAHGAAMWNLGVIMDLAPVLDTANPNNTIAEENQRSFSENGQTAAAYGIAFANGLRASGVVPVAKHFPGLGHASANTDLGPATDPSLAQLEANDLIPFEQAIARGVPAIMVSHASVPGLTGTVPASLSPATYQFLRNNLHFKGVTMTDSLGAGAIAATGYSQASAAVAAIEAGANMVMINRVALPSTLSALQQAISSGALSLNQVNASVAQILVSKGHAVCQ